MRRKRLTFRELEALTSLGLTGFLAFNSTRVTGHEALLAEHGLIFGVDLHESTGDTEAESLSLVE